MGTLALAGSFGAYAGYAGYTGSTATRSTEVPIEAGFIDGLIPASRAKAGPAISGGGDWINSEPLSLASLKGRVVLVDFWTFGCYNCRNTLPALKRVDSEFRAKGLTIVGVHTPESDHEGNLNNLKNAIEKLGIKYPVVTDNKNNIWDTYEIKAWPTVVILDRQGRIRYKYVGEGAYDTQEKVIQFLLSEN